MSRQDAVADTRTTPEAAPHLWRSSALGEVDEVQIGRSRLQYFRRGEGSRQVVFAHGWLSNANLWRKVVDVLADRCTCYVLDLPLGAHRVAMDPDADLSPDGCGSLIASALEELDLADDAAQARGGARRLAGRADRRGRNRCGQ